MSKIKICALGLCLSMMMIACSEDPTDGVSESGISIENFGIDSDNDIANGGGNNNDGPNRPDSNDDVSYLSTDVLFQWTELFLDIERYALGLRPNGSARAIAYINLAAYETAVPGMRDFVSNDGKLPGYRLSARLNPDQIDFELALNACYADVLDYFLINVSGDQKSGIPVLEQELEQELSQGLGQRRINDSKQWGAQVAAHIIAYAESDQEAVEQLQDPQPRSYEPPTGAGYWTYSADPERALFPYWGKVRSFIVQTKETTTVAPKTYSENPNSPYYREMKDCYDRNNRAKANQGEGLWVAEFWSDDVENLMFSPPARQLAIANQLVEQYDMSLAEGLHMYLKLGFSLNDAAVTTWKYKYEHMVMRPNVYIHEFIDPSFQTNLYRLVYWPNPSFPGYPSGHSCFASAASGVFIEFFGNQTNFTDRSHEGRTEFLSEPRTFSSFTDMAEENAFARVPLGVHMNMDCAEGLRLGYEISDGINEYKVLRRSN